MRQPQAEQVQDLLRSVDHLADLAMAEDLGGRGDISTQCAGLAGSTRAVIRADEPGVFAGTLLLRRLLEKLAPKVKIEGEPAAADGQPFEKGDHLLNLTGPVQQMLAAERTLLNFLQRLCGIATLTRKFVDAIAGTQAKIYDTRKTTPGWRILEKYAVRCGGGYNHRTGLFDAIILKDNHLAHVDRSRLPEYLRQTIERARALEPPAAFVEVEVEDLETLQAVLSVQGINIVMLDNFTPDQLREAVSLRDAMGLKGKVELEASGGITLENVRQIASTGVERISVGAITHSAPALHLSLEMASR